VNLEGLRACLPAVASAKVGGLEGLGTEPLEIQLAAVIERGLDALPIGCARAGELRVEGG
jgi:hypothetical protein